mmetsp:Transcript_43804/g.88334  ORF Transcript_43804/g.88334 Transcript_43804/m.88334 type:complete len:428 (-) Transcript_43804:129-1412(-)
MVLTPKPSRRTSVFDQPPARNRTTVAESMPEKDLEDLIVRMWNRLDRDMSGTITKEELNCEEFHNMVLAAVAPVTKSGGGGGALYSRSQLNMAEAIAFCLRKADQNDDGNLSFAEFRSLVKTLQDVHVQPSSAHLAFSLFDLDYSLTIDKMEFKEVMRFFMGHNPTEVEYREEWARLSSRSRGDKVTRDDYIRWLQTTPNPVFHQHAPPVQSEGEKGESKSLADLSRSHSSGLREKARWNKRFNACMNPLHVNDFRPQALREYFSTSQSVPELRSFYDTYPDAFKKHRARMDAPSSPEATCALWPKSVSTEGGTPLLLPKRHEPRGLMRHHRTGEVALWDDNWSPPIRLKSRFKPGDKPYAPKALFGELTDVFALSREGIGVKPEPKAARRRTTRVPGGAPLGGTGPRADAMNITPARPTTLEAEPW